MSTAPEQRSTTTTNPKKRLWCNYYAEKNGDPIIYKILEGAMKYSDYSSFCLLVPEDSVQRLLNAFRNAKCPQHVWTIGDEEITDIQNIPPQFAHPIRSILGEIPKDKTETELLDWLTHGESFFSKKYVILKFVDTQDDSICEQVYEIKKKEHLEKFTDAIKKIEWYQEAEDDTVDMENWYVIDRVEYLRKFDFCKVVDDDVMESFERMAEDNDNYIKYYKGTTY